MSFSDCLSSYKPSICLKTLQFFLFFSRTTGPILTKLVTKHPWVKEWSESSFFYEKPKFDIRYTKIHWQNIKTCLIQNHLSNFNKFGKKHSWMKGVLVCLNEEPHPLTTTKNIDKIINLIRQNHWTLGDSRFWFLLMLFHTCNRSFAQMCLLNGTVSRVSDVVHVSLVCVCVWAVNGDWTNWSEWTPCDVTCGTGLQTRRRNCSNPEPAFGGKICPGYKTEARNCQPRYCQSMYLLNEFSFCT